MDSNLVEIATHEDIGYRSLIFFEGWRVAILNDDPEAARMDKIRFFERHMETDEVFVLLSGECTLLIGGSDNKPGKIELVQMEMNKIYNVRKAVWHNAVGSEGFSVLIVENATTSKQNTEYYSISLEDQK